MRDQYQVGQSGNFGADWYAGLKGIPVMLHTSNTFVWVYKLHTFTKSHKQVMRSYGIYHTGCPDGKWCFIGLAYIE